MSQVTSASLGSSICPFFLMFPLPFSKEVLPTCYLADSLPVPSNLTNTTFPGSCWYPPLEAAGCPCCMLTNTEVPLSGLGDADHSCSCSPLALGYGTHCLLSCSLSSPRTQLMAVPCPPPPHGDSPAVFVVPNPALGQRLVGTWLSPADC